MACTVVVNICLAFRGQDKRLSKLDEEELKQMILKDFQSKSGKAKNDEIVKDAMKCIKNLIDDKNRNLVSFEKNGTVTKLITGDPTKARRINACRRKRAGPDN